MTKKLAVTRYTQNGYEFRVTYICAGSAEDSAEAARKAATAALRPGEKLEEYMQRVDGCCTWPVNQGSISHLPAAGPRASAAGAVVRGAAASRGLGWAR